MQAMTHTHLTFLKRFSEFNIISSLQCCSLASFQPMLGNWQRFTAASRPYELAGGVQLEFGVFRSLHSRAASSFSNQRQEFENNPSRQGASACRTHSSTNLNHHCFSSLPVEEKHSVEAESKQNSKKKWRQRRVNSRKDRTEVKNAQIQQAVEDFDELRKVDLPTLHPKASLTSEHHPCGSGLLEFPFSAKAFYVGKGYGKQLEKLGQAAKAEGWQAESNGGSQLFCLRRRSQAFNQQEDFTAREFLPQGLPCETYIMPLDKMDAVVFFNGFGREKQIWEDHTGSQLSSKFVEETRVTVIPGLDKASKLFSDRVVLQQAELNYLRTIGFVLAQTVSLHFYEMQVDRMLRAFKDMNREMQRTGSFQPVASKEELLQMVAHNNLLFSDIISKLGIMERFDVAWKSSKCNDIYEHLRADMEIENRNSNLQVKLHLVSENVKYLLELMQNQKSDFLEWIIIVLIGAEILVSLFDMFHKIN